MLLNNPLKSQGNLDDQHVLLFHLHKPLPFILLHYDQSQKQKLLKNKPPGWVSLLTQPTDHEYGTGGKIIMDQGIQDNELIQRSI